MTRRIRQLIGALVAFFTAVGTPVAAAEAALPAPGILAARPGLPSLGTDAPRGFRRLHQTGMSRAGTLYVPSGYDPSRPAPLLVLLHGAGGDPRRAIDGLKPLAEASGTIVLAPASDGPTWDLVTDRRFGVDARMLDALLRELFARYAVDPGRIAIAGFSDGGSYALSLGLSNGDLFSRVVAFAPGFVLPLRQSGRPALFISHGRSDAVLPIDATGRPAARLLTSAGYAVRYHEFDGGHSVPPGVAAEAFAWLAAPAAPAPAAPTAIPLASPSDGTVELPLEQLLWPGQDRPVARWLAPVCPRVVGAASTFTHRLEAQFYGVAGMVGAPVARRPCVANLTIDIRRTAVDAPPVVPRYTFRSSAPSRAFKSVTLVVDKARAETAPIEALGAYVALVSLAELDVTAPRPKTLLALFDDPAAPQRLTTRDLDLLHRLYADAKSSPATP